MRGREKKKIGIKERESERGSLIEFSRLNSGNFPTAIICHRRIEDARNSMFSSQVSGNGFPLPFEHYRSALSPNFGDPATDYNSCD